MSLSQLDITLQSALQEYGLRELPPEWNPDTSTLVDGIALVMKATGKEYCKVANKDGNIAVVRDYGKCAAIHKIEKVFGVNVLTKANIPPFKSDEEIILYLCKSRYDRAEIEELLKTDREEVNRRINNLALETEKRKIAEKKRCEEIKEFAQKAKEEKAKQKANGTNNNKTRRGNKQSRKSDSQ